MQISNMTIAGFIATATQLSGDPEQEGLATRIPTPCNVEVCTIFRRGSQIQLQLHWKSRPINPISRVLKGEKTGDSNWNP